MSLNFYKPNKSNKGACLSINVSAKTDKDQQKGDKSFYFTLLTQTAWDEERGVGSFKDGKKITSKFSPMEAAAMIECVNRNKDIGEIMSGKPGGVYHDGLDYGLSIIFGPHYKKENKGGKWVDTNIQSGFVLRITKTSKENKDNKDSIAIGFNFAETRLLLKFLDNGLTHICDAMYSEDINRHKETKANDKKVKKSSSSASSSVVENNSSDEEEEGDVTNDTPPDDSW